MRPVDIHKVTARARTSGWILTICCGLSLPFCLTDILSLLVCGIGLTTGVLELKLQDRIHQAPRKQLRLLGRWQILFTCLLACYFAQKIILAGAMFDQMSPAQIQDMNRYAPGLKSTLATVTRLIYLAIGIVAVTWQGWTSYRYYRDARNLRDEAYKAPVTFFAKPEEKQTLTQLAQTYQTTEEEILRRALIEYAASPKHQNHVE